MGVASVYEEEYIDALNILTEGTKSEQIDEKIAIAKLEAQENKKIIR